MKHISGTVQKSHGLKKLKVQEFVRNKIQENVFSLGKQTEAIKCGEKIYK